MSSLLPGAVPVTTDRPRPQNALPAGPPPQAGRLQAYRDDGPVAHALGRLTKGQLPPLLPLLVAAVVTAILLAVGVPGQHSPALLAPVLAVLLAGPGATHPHIGRLDWLVPPLIRAIEYGYIATLGFSHDVSKPLVYAFLGVLAYHHYDTVYRTRQRLWPARWVFHAGLGWDVRLLVMAAAALAGSLPLAFAVLGGYLALLFGAESVYTWTRTGTGSGVMINLEEEEEAAS